MGDALDGGPVQVSAGLYAAGWLADAPAFKWIGAALAAAGVVAYLALATAFGGEAFRLIGARGSSPSASP